MTKCHRFTLSAWLNTNCLKPFLSLYLYLFSVYPSPSFCFLFRFTIKCVMTCRNDKHVYVYIILSHPKASLSRSTFWYLMFVLCKARITCRTQFLFATLLRFSRFHCHTLRFFFCLFVSFCCFLLNLLILIHGEKVCALLFLYRELFFLLARTHTGNDNCTLFRHFNKNYYAYHLSRDGNAYESVRSTCPHFNKTHKRWIRTIAIAFQML